MTLSVSLRHGYGGFDLDLAFEATQVGVTALFGPSGSGKSTTVNAVAGLLRPDRGRVEINGRTVFDSRAGVDLRPRERQIGYVFQEGRLFPHLTVRENLLYGWRRARQRGSEADVAEVIDLLGLEALLRRGPARLSGGERQRVAIGRALLCGPSLLLLDEPLASLDFKRRSEILPYLEGLRQTRRVPMLYVSHSIDEVTRLADTVQVIDGGRIVASGSVAEVFSRVDLYPITGRFEAGAVIDARVVEHDASYQLSRLSFAGGELSVPRVEAEPGASVRVRVRARDILLATTEPSALSANNVLQARVLEVRRDPGPYADVRVAAGEAVLIARVTRASLDRLALRVGDPVYAIAKTVTIDQLSVT